RLDVLLKEFRASRNHMAMVVDEYGSVVGLVTIEDVLEQIVGEIDDEHDVDEGDSILRHNDTRFTVKGLLPLADFNEYFQTDFAADAETIGELVVKNFAHMPKRGEKITLGACRFKVVRADNRRVHLLEVVFTAAVPARTQTA